MESILKWIRKGYIMNVIDILSKEHKKVSNFFEEIKDKSHREEIKRKIFQDLSQLLICHKTIEQKV